MKSILGIIKYLFSIAVTPLALLVLWVFEKKPLTSFINYIDWQRAIDLQDNTKAAIDLAF